MKNPNTHKVVLPTGDTSGKATEPAFAEMMNLLIKVLIRFGLLKKDLDYHLVRAFRTHCVALSGPILKLKLLWSGTLMRFATGF
jgi:hypothetical protein